MIKETAKHNLLKGSESLELNFRRKRCKYEKRRRANESEESIQGKEKNVQMNLLNLEKRDWQPNLSIKDKKM